MIFQHNSNKHTKIEVSRSQYNSKLLVKHSLKKSLASQQQASAANQLKFQEALSAQQKLLLLTGLSLQKTLGLNNLLHQSQLRHSKDKSMKLLLNVQQQLNRSRQDQVCNDHLHHKTRRLKAFVLLHVVLLHEKVCEVYLEPLAAKVADL